MITEPVPLATVPGQAEPAPAPTQPEKNAPQSTADPYAGIDPALADLMRADNVTPGALRRAVASKGYLPAELPVSQYPADFVAGCLVAAWPQVRQLARQMGASDGWTELAGEDDDLPF